LGFLTKELPTWAGLPGCWAEPSTKKGCTYWRKAPRGTPLLMHLTNSSAGWGHFFMDLLCECCFLTTGVLFFESQGTSQSYSAVCMSYDQNRFPLR
jgi:hypothetical protein